MTNPPFDFSTFYNDGLPAPAALTDGSFPKFNFVGGHNAPDQVPVEALLAAANKVIKREGKNLATYSPHGGPQGYLPLREFLTQKLKATAGMDCDASEILLTSGSLQGIDLVNAALLSPGDTVIIEEANYGGCLSRFNQARVNTIGIPLDKDGMRIDKLEAALKGCAQKGIRPKYIYTIPTVQNPTGSIMTRARREQLIDLATEHSVPIFEDECYADLIWDGQRPPAIYALDQTRRTIHIGSFSKSVAPALRVGYLVAPPAVMSQLLALKTDAGSGALEQMVLAEFCRDHFHDHVIALNTALKRRLDALTAALSEHFGTAAEFDVPPGGIFLWVKLPKEVDTSKLAQAALADGVAINPGAEWSIAGEDAKRYMRLCFANPDENTLRAGVAALAEICHRAFGVPERSANRDRSK